MSQFYFDVIILGDSLAGRVAGTLLARGGQRVMMLRPSLEATAPGWLLPSLLLERLLEKLDGRTVLNGPLRFQLLLGEVRLEFNGETPWPVELRRELPRGAQAAENVLGELEATGNTLSELIWENRGWPLTGTTSRWRFHLQCLRRGLGLGTAWKTLADRLQTVGPQPSRELLSALFSGLTLLPPDQITTAEAALLWHGARQGRRPSYPALADLLQRRFVQFHGEEDALARLERIESVPGSGLRLMLKGGRVLVGGRILLSSPEHTLPFSPPLPPLSLLQSPTRLRWQVTSGSAPPLLADHLILGDAPPLRLTRDDPAGGWEVEIGRFTAAGVPDLENRLRKIAPFVDWKPVAGELPASPLPDPAAPGIRRVFLDRQVALCGPEVFPAMGGAGEILTGYSLAEHLLKESGKAGQ